MVELGDGVGHQVGVRELEATVDGEGGPSLPGLLSRENRKSGASV
ncbi:hypothetical protein [Streptomyces sp. ISL-36]|nr:hypothetical protein [Streptomyces sp. ISL-36]